MPDTARQFEQPPSLVAATDPLWSDTRYGEVGAMHHKIEQRLLSGPFDLAVVPLLVRPGEEILARLSRVAGWLTLAGAFAAAATALFKLLS